MIFHPAVDTGNNGNKSFINSTTTAKATEINR
jgi:hypothetical protein